MSRYRITFLVNSKLHGVEFDHGEDAKVVADTLHAGGAKAVTVFKRNSADGNFKVTTLAAVQAEVAADSKLPTAPAESHEEATANA